MSRIGKRPIAIPSGVKVSLQDGQLFVEGPKGKLQRTCPEGANVSISENEITVELPPQKRRDTSAQGLIRTLINNMVVGVSEGFSRNLEIVGVGYRADLKGDKLNLALGYSHPIEYPLPEGITVDVEKQTKLTVKGIDKELVGATAAKIRSLREPEPYKGKGIRYSDERVLIKAGKTGKK